MEGPHQDLIGNLAMFVALLISAQKTPRRKNFWLRLIAGLVLFSALRYVYFSHLSPLLVSWDTMRYTNMAAFSAFIPLTATAALFCWEMDFWAAL